MMLTYGAHLIKNGLAPVVIRLLEEGWVTHVATNGAGSIHDWEFAFLGRSSEDVRANVARGQFGTWEETGRYINLAVAVGGTQELGYGWSVGKLIADEELLLPSVAELREEARAGGGSGDGGGAAGSAGGFAGAGLQFRPADRADGDSALDETVQRAGGGLPAGHPLHRAPRHRL